MELLEHNAESQLDMSTTSRKVIVNTHLKPQATAHSPLLLLLFVSVSIFTLRFVTVKVFLFAQKSWKPLLLQNKQKYVEWSKILMKNFLTPDVNRRRRKLIGKVMNRKTRKRAYLEKQ